MKLTLSFAVPFLADPARNFEPVGVPTTLRDLLVGDSKLQKIGGLQSLTLEVSLPFSHLDHVGAEILFARIR